MTYVVAYLAGLGVLIAYFLVCLAVGRTWRFWVLAEGQDGRLSTSKAQWQLWTVAVAFSYVAIYGARAVHGDHSPLSTVPQNVLIALGFSSVTMAGAKGITTSYVAQGKTVKADPVGSSRLTDLVVDDTGASDLSKTQLLIWTLIAIGVFITNVVYQIGDIYYTGATTASSSVPDIDTTLMILSGLAMGGYLGKKLVTTSSVHVSSILPTSMTRAAATSPSALSVYGSGFGDPIPPPPAARVPVIAPVAPAVPAAPAAPAAPGAPPPPAPSTPAAPAAPPPVPAIPAGPPPPLPPPGCAVLANGFQALIDSWKDTQVVFHLDATHPSLAPLSGSPPLAQVSIRVSLVVAGTSGFEAGDVVVVL